MCRRGTWIWSVELSRWRAESGVALVIAMMTITLLTALGTALALMAAAETQVAATCRAAAEALYAADAAAELLVDEVRDMPDWALLFTGEARSRYVDGLPRGVRSTPAGPIDLARAVDQPGWLLQAHGALRDFLGPVAGESSAYVIVWVAPAAARRMDTLAIRAHAYGLGGVRRAVEVRLVREGAAIRRLSWHEVR